jgi:transketolase
MNGNDMDDTVKTLDKAKSMTGQGKPICILMKTGMGKGVDFMEGSHEWHGIAPNDEQLAKHWRSCRRLWEIIKKYEF